jgi:mRNA interferase RelE/StbE
MPPLDDRFSARLGTYRVVYLFDDELRLVTVVAVALRADVYRT